MLQKTRKTEQKILPSDIRQTEQSVEKTARVLLVEDDRTNLLIAKKMLAKAGLEIISATNGQQAVELFGKHNFDLVFMDLQMPIMGGIEATRKIRDAYPQRNIPIIAMTANVLPEHKKMCLEAGMNDFISKPVNLQKLHAVINKYM